MAARRKRPGGVVAGVESELATFPAWIRELATARVALQLAREMDSPDNSATSKSMCARQLMDAMSALRALAPPRQEADGVDDIARKRAQRRSGGAAAADSASS